MYAWYIIIAKLNNNELCLRTHLELIKMNNYCNKAAILAALSIN